MSILLFDSGIGGLSVLREVRVMLPGRRIVYVGDDAGFPYGEWEEQALIPRVVALFERCLEAYDPELAIVACNTASTLIMPALRERFSIPIVGTVPPIKPAAKLTASGLVSVLATPGTVTRPYTLDMVREFSRDATVKLVGSTGLARLAEQHMQGEPIDRHKLRSELMPCFVQVGSRRTDIIVLGCTHYPFLVHEMRKLAPWPVDWIEPAEAIARRALSLIGPVPPDDPRERMADIALMTAGSPSTGMGRLLAGFGLVPADRPFRPLDAPVRQAVPA